MKILIACECSGRVREAFRALGHDVLSCDLEDTEIPGPHYRGNVLDIIGDGWDMLLAFPPCTYLTSASGGLYTGSRLEREAIDLVLQLGTADIEKICIENPRGSISRLVRKPDQEIQPYWFGEPYSKRTALWLKNLPLLEPTHMVPYVEYVRTRSRTAKDRARTFRGVARAMAAQWG